MWTQLTPGEVWQFCGYHQHCCLIILGWNSLCVVIENEPQTMTFTEPRLIRARRVIPLQVSKPLQSETFSFYCTCLLFSLSIYSSSHSSLSNTVLLSRLTLWDEPHLLEHLCQALGYHWSLPSPLLSPQPSLCAQEKSTNLQKNHPVQRLQAAQDAA